MTSLSDQQLRLPVLAVMGVLLTLLFGIGGMTIQTERPRVDPLEQRGSNDIPNQIDRTKTDLSAEIGLLKIDVAILKVQGSDNRNVLDRIDQRIEALQATLR